MRLLKMITFVLLMVASVQSNAQFNLSGKIANYSGKETLKVNIPIVYGYNGDTEINIPIDKNGNFSIDLPIKEKKFGDLIFEKTFYTYLLTPGKSLHVLCKTQDSTVSTVSGTSAKENQLLTQINLNEQPFFMLKGKVFNDSLTSISAVEEKAIKPMMKIRDSNIELVKSSSISNQDKSLIIAEIKYHTLNILQEIRYIIPDKKIANDFYLHLYDPLSTKPEVFPAGPQYYAFIRYYLGYLGPKTIANKDKKGLSDKEPLDFYKISYDSANVVERKFGKPYLRWMLANNIQLPLKVIEQLTYKEIIDVYNSNDIRLLAPLVDAYTKQFKTGALVLDAKKRIAKLKLQWAINEKNKNIQIVNNFETTRSIYDVIKPLKGKVVLLDVWGTWCGPCKEELKYVPDLKAKFKGKEVAFVYLDLDEESLDPKWREFIITNNMEGLHLRKTRQTIVPFWKELLANAEDKAEYYPQYFIFDKAGKLVVSKAKRPSQKEELYTQIEQFLK
ncbi:TlpA disulfide reductase family protein [Pedobacter sp. Du54]|uniref:TlpA family protein disulfide reductase n=1 Tax=Pedobacter anseongensis TaxID=3133439 RepID=UPI0030A14DE5